MTIPPENRTEEPSKKIPANGKSVLKVPYKNNNNDYYYKGQTMATSGALPKIVLANGEGDK